MRGRLTKQNDSITGGMGGDLGGHKASSLSDQGALGGRAGAFSNLRESGRTAASASAFRMPIVMLQLEHQVSILRAAGHLNTWADVQPLGLNPNGQQFFVRRSRKERFAKRWRGSSSVLEPQGVAPGRELPQARSLIIVSLRTSTGSASRASACFRRGCRCGIFICASRSASLRQFS